MGVVSGDFLGFDHEDDIFSIVETISVALEYYGLEIVESVHEPTGIFTPESVMFELRKISEGER